jgi:chromosome segregation protein
MLKRLELVGFKSFADKTRFDFPPGIAAIVGPNGSGKSNVADAVRWVLGEQSAKSMRGGEMADVIFNGSTTRRSLGMAEVTMTFDNRRRILATPADEVQITRRVYRDGQGEYLINHEPRRLKDIRDLFLGTGAGTDAYCVIEQGRVDVLLQASTKDRRMIFEEAAGISRFRIKKIETLRKLEQVDQNLQRFRDIIDEVEKQLRSVKLQAAKAQRHHEYSERIKELRVALGLKEYRELAGQLQAQGSILDDLRRQLAEHAVQLKSLEEQIKVLDGSLSESAARIHDQEALLAQAQKQIAAQESTLNHESQLSLDLEKDLERSGRLLWERREKEVGLEAAAQSARADASTVEAQCRLQKQALVQMESDLEQTLNQVADLQQQMQKAKTEHFELMRQAARMQNDAISFGTQVEHLERNLDRLQVRNRQAAEQHGTLEQELNELSQQEEALQSRLLQGRRTLVEERHEQESIEKRCQALNEENAALQARSTGLYSRMEVLEGLDRSREGANAGVKEVLDLVNQSEPGPWQTVLGILGEFLTVSREFASMIDLALGDRSQYFLVSDPSTLDKALGDRIQAFSSRVGFLSVKPADSIQTPRSENRLTELSEPSRVRMPCRPDGTPIHPGIIARADQLVSSDRLDLSSLLFRLLGTTLIVEDLATACAISIHTNGFRFITRQGEILEADGALTVGRYKAEAGIISRKTELRDLRAEAEVVQSRFLENRASLEALRGHSAKIQDSINLQLEETKLFADKSAELRSLIGQRRDRQQTLREEISVGQAELDGCGSELQELRRAWEQARGEAEGAEQQVRTLETRMEAIESQVCQKEQNRREQQEASTVAKVGLAQIEERLEALRSKVKELQVDLEEHEREKMQDEQQYRSAQTRLCENRGRMLEASSELANWVARKEAAQSNLRKLEEERNKLRFARQSIADRAQAARAGLDQWQEQVHAGELGVNDLQHRQSSLTLRLGEDYQLDLAELARSRFEPEDAGVPIASETAQEEIDELRRKLGRLGSVNLESVREMSELDARAESLRLQYDDLVAAKRSLEEIIAKINQDSRRLFAQVFSDIRDHFQELFRKLFGGGMADIVLENENDVLESGVDIIARPPGKELRSISLLSGGEKTLTAVALLLAIFRSRPCPFCILDEVDAALDEANIGRFATVLRDFLDRSHFIIITHSKRTMAIADVLYGITMQESGVSRPVAVRLADWPEDVEAEPRPTARAG